MATISSDLIWELLRTSNSQLVKRKTGGGAYFSRDPLNLTNTHSRKHEGFVNNKAIGVTVGKEGGVVLTTKKSANINKPASSLSTTTFGANTPSRKTYRAIAGNTAKQGYRADLRHSAIARASAIRKSQRPVKADRPVKARGSKAKKAE